MSKIINKINLLSIYDNENFHHKDFDSLQTRCNTCKNDFKQRYISISLNFTDNTILNINAECNGIPGDEAWFVLLSDISNALIGTEFIDVIETEPDETKFKNMFVDCEKTYHCDEGRLCKIQYVKNNLTHYYDFLLYSTIPHYYGYSDWIELIPDYQVTPMDVFEKNSITLLVGQPCSGKSFYLKQYLSNPNYLLLDDFISYLSFNVDSNTPNVDWFDNKEIGSYNKKTKEFTDTIYNTWEHPEWDDVYSNRINFATRKQIHDWLKKNTNNKVIIADAKLCNEGYYNYVIRTLNIYNKEEVIKTLLFDTPQNVCEERLKIRHEAENIYKRMKKSMSELSNIFNINNSCYINPEIHM